MLSTHIPIPTISPSPNTSVLCYNPYHRNKPNTPDRHKLKLMATAHGAKENFSS